MGLVRRAKAAYDERVRSRDQERAVENETKKKFCREKPRSSSVAPLCLITRQAIVGRKCADGLCAALISNAPVMIGTEFPTL
jgi:hypothetical protein